jgi:hypothetical protein
VPQFFPPGSLAEHCVTHHGFPVGKTVTDATHRSDHEAHDRAVAWLSQLAVPERWQVARLSAVLPIRHAYTLILAQEVLAV